MDIVKVKGGYTDNHALRDLIAYATCSEKTKGYIGAIGTNPYDPDKMLEQMQFVKRAYGKSDRNYRQLRHIIISPDPQWGITVDVAYRMAYDIAKFYGNRYQICFGVHSDTDILQELMEAELDATLGYGNNQKADSDTDKKRNGYSTKSVKSQYEQFQLDVPVIVMGSLNPNRFPNISGLYPELKIKSFPSMPEARVQGISMTSYRIYMGLKCLLKWSVKSQIVFCRKLRSGGLAR